ncbi:A-kinase anchor protein inhibitor 1 [Ambystoma mexicanum]|uniref:A-kinase anchor protein inhibitor 1 n=1 Tax=Ambystoma mexicanum TaxID=8296 RepID=UPI0037E74653
MKREGKNCVVARISRIVELHGEVVWPEVKTEVAKIHVIQPLLHKLLVGEETNEDEFVLGAFQFELLQTSKKSALQRAITWATAYRPDRASSLLGAVQRPSQTPPPAALPALVSHPHLPHLLASSLSQTVCLSSRRLPQTMVFAPGEKSGNAQEEVKLQNASKEIVQTAIQQALQQVSQESQPSDKQSNSTAPLPTGTGALTKKQSKKK